MRGIIIRGVSAALGSGMLAVGAHLLLSYHESTKTTLAHLIGSFVLIIAGAVMISIGSMQNETKQG